MKKVILMMMLAMASFVTMAQNAAERMLEPSDLVEQQDGQCVVKSGTAIAECLAAKGWEVKEPATENRVQASVSFKNDKGATYTCELYRSSYIEIHFGTKAETIDFYNKVKDCKPKGLSWTMNANTVILD